MVNFSCNICAAWNSVENFATEPASCACGSNVRLRALIYMLSMELFGQNLPLVEFPRLKSVRGLGMSDQPGYAAILAEKFDYTNTFYDREPRWDFTQAHPERYGTYDFVLSADVLEHIAPPVERALIEVRRLLKPCGFFGITVFCNPSDRLLEHYPHLHDFRIVAVGGKPVVVNRRADGTLETYENLVFHSGGGATLEMREYGASALEAQLIGAGFSEVSFLRDEVPEAGILFDSDVSQPLIAKKAPFAADRWFRSDLVAEWKKSLDREAAERQRVSELELQLRAVAGAKWIKLGRRFGLGPRFD